MDLRTQVHRNIPKSNTFLGLQLDFFSATVGLRKSPPPIEKSPPLAKKSPTPIKKSPTLTQKNPTLIEKILLEKSPPLTKKSLTSMRKSPVAHTRNILRSSEYIFTHVLLDFGIF